MSVQGHGAALAARKRFRGGRSRERPLGDTARVTDLGSLWQRPTGSSSVSPGQAHLTGR